MPGHIRWAKGQPHRVTDGMYFCWVTGQQGDLGTLWPGSRHKQALCGGAGGQDLPACFACSPGLTGLRGSW